MDYQKFFLSIDGRLNRKPFWLGILALLVANLVVSGLGVVIGGALGNAIAFIFGIALIWPGICVSGKRWHDRDKSAWWMLISLVPIIGIIWAFVENGCLRGTVGPNAFGPDPLLDDIA